MHLGILHHEISKMMGWIFFPLSPLLHEPTLINQTSEGQDNKDMTMDFNPSQILQSGTLELIVKQKIKKTIIHSDTK